MFLSICEIWATHQIQYYWHTILINCMHLERNTYDTVKKICKWCVSHKLLEHFFHIKVVNFWQQIVPTPFICSIFLLKNKNINVVAETIKPKKGMWYWCILLQLSSSGKLYFFPQSRIKMMKKFWKISKYFEIYPFIRSSTYKFCCYSICRFLSRRSIRKTQRKFENKTEILQKTRHRFWAEYLAVNDAT